MEQNPYQSPRANLTGYSSTGQLGKVPEPVVNELLRTKGWVRFISVLFFIVSGLMGLLMLVSLAGLPAGTGALPGFVFMVIYVAVYLSFAIYLGRYASAIGRLRLSRSMADLHSALSHQRAFWKLAGVLALIAVILVAALLGLGFATGTGFLDSNPF